MGTLHTLTTPREGARFARDLAGRCPIGHPGARRGKRGGVILEEGQVWVLGHSGELWTLVSFCKAERSGTYKHDVVIRPYHADYAHIVKKISEQTFRSNFKIWEEHLRANLEILEKLKHEATRHGHTFEGACKFFGIDPITGDRIKE